MMVVAPSSSSWRTASKRAASPTASMTMTDATPSTIPSAVKKERRRWAARERSARCRTWKKRSDIGLFRGRDPRPCIQCDALAFDESVFDHDEFLVVLADDDGARLNAKRPHDKGDVPPFAFGDGLHGNHQHIAEAIDEHLDLAGHPRFDPGRFGQVLDLDDREIFLPALAPITVLMRHRPNGN